MPSTVFFASGKTIKDNIKYKYDNCGNITEIRENGELIARYKYDSLNRLIREDNKQLDTTCVIDYDSNGNILTKRVTYFTLNSSLEQEEFEAVNNYYYEGDRLVSFNGKSCVYNNAGSPTTYMGKAATWLYGKFLSNYGNTSFTYDAKGRRLSKGNITFTYDNDGRLIKQADSSNTYNNFEFIYDNSGVVGLKQGGAQYFYRKDAQGNIIAILDSVGNAVVKYEYDAWGGFNIVGSLASTLGTYNPFCYRGYYYDRETGLYYLHSRYYDPETGRFISQDSIEYAAPETINGLNLYAYCGNNPVMYTDPTGTTKWWEWALLAIAVVAIVAAGIVATVATGGASLVAGGMAIVGTIGFFADLAVQASTNGIDNLNIAELATTTLLGTAIGAGVGYLAGAGAGAGAVGASMVLVGGGTVSVGVAQVTMTLLGVIVLLSSDPYVEYLKKGMSKHQQDEFKKLIEDYKEEHGRGGDKNIPKSLLKEFAEWVKNNIGKKLW